MTQSARKRFHWGLVVFYITLLYSTLPLAPWLYSRIAGLSAGSFGIYLNVLILSIGISLSGYLPLVRIEKRPWPYLWLIGIAIGYGLFLATVELPSERIHFLEYGVLGWLLMNALSHDYNSHALLLVAALMIVILGFVDEGIQWVLPNRFFELRDVGMNTAGGLLGILLMRFVIPAKM